MDAPGIVLIECARIKLRLTAFACAKAWLSANPVAPPVWEGRVACHGCPAGAARAGGKIDQAAAVRERLAPICPRCRKTSDRIINGRLCVSCYNRHHEVLRGRNPKGQFPVRVAARLFACRMVAIEAGTAVRIEDSLCSGVVELALAKARKAKDASLCFGWAPPAGGLAA